MHNTLALREEKEGIGVQGSNRTMEKEKNDHGCCGVLGDEFHALKSLFTAFSNFLPILNDNLKGFVLS